ncbi:hypothetical protein [Mariniplasma anaerobium]|uniref:Uncharacterized protein n=1 Tax=Mariniplasma anaerobium TaxID=2735436 RepID=A0A7U9TH65_9MOLU|nr:hypothetical protein [Mariniplasma anaerobium]BCR35732.1 hypothetical protein MPAN_006250 [Mariniplasma anaerobium]
MNLIKRYVLLIVISTLLAFSYAMITTKIEIETLINWSAYLVPSIFVFNIMVFIAIFSEAVSILKKIASIDFNGVFMPLNIKNKDYMPLFKLSIEIKPNHLRSVVSRC